MRLHGNVFLPPFPLNALAARVEGSRARIARPTSSKVPDWAGPNVRVGRQVEPTLKCPIDSAGKRRFMADYGLTCAWLVSVRGLRVLQTRDISNIHLSYLQHSQASTMLNSRKARLPGGCHVRYS
jgi:hypothetical protein